MRRSRDCIFLLVPSRYKSLTRSQCEALEEDFQLYMRERSIGKRTNEQRLVRIKQYAGGSGSSSSKDLVVNYSESKISQPFEGRLQRQFQRGLWLQVGTATN